MNTTLCLLLLRSGLVTLACGVSVAMADVAPAGVPSAAPSTVKVAPPASTPPAPTPNPTSSRLLSLAQEVAGAIPTDPHVKDRSRAQQEIFETRLALGDRAGARASIEPMETWRRGFAFAQLADAAARGKDAVEAERMLELAQREADRNEEWRRDRILVEIAKVRELLGQSERARALEMGLDPSESGKVDSVRVVIEPAEHFDQRVQSLDAVIAIRGFDSTKSACAALLQMHERYVGDTERRTRIEQSIRMAAVQLPVVDQVGLLFDLAANASSARSLETAVAFLDDAARLIETTRWLPEDRLPLMARLAEARYAAGQSDLATTTADAALAFYKAERAAIVDVFRAAALRPLAEAQAAMGNQDAALDIYRLVVEDGALNPNARPRALDLSATCCSMAAHGIEPDAELWEKLREIQRRLGPPW